MLVRLRPGSFRQLRSRLRRCAGYANPGSCAAPAAGEEGRQLCGTAAPKAEKAGCSSWQRLKAVPAAHRHRGTCTGMLQQPALTSAVSTEVCGLRKGHVHGRLEFCGPACNTWEGAGSTSF